MSKKNKLSVQSYVSFAAAIIILALGAKILHYSWAEYLIIFGFALEFIVFIVLGFTTRETDELRVVGGSNLDSELIIKLESTLSKLENTQNKLELSTEVSSKILAALINQLGVDKIAKALDRPNEIASLDINGLQEKILTVGTNFEILNNVLVDLTNHYSKQVEAFKSK